jgi:hypothetical protein
LSITSSPAHEHHFYSGHILDRPGGLIGYSYTTNVFPYALHCSYNRTFLDKTLWLLQFMHASFTEAALLSGSLIMDSVAHTHPCRSSDLGKVRAPTGVISHLCFLRGVLQRTYCTEDYSA